MQRIHRLMSARASVLSSRPPRSAHAEPELLGRGVGGAALCGGAAEKRKSSTTLFSFCSISLRELSAFDEEEMPDGTIKLNCVVVRPIL